MIKPIEWQIGTVRAITPETSRAKSITLSLPDWTPHLPGQHYDIRLTAADGYQAQRSYSVASEPERAGQVDLTVERIEEGEVSPYLSDVLVVGDKVELRGPIGGYFVWETALGGPLLLIAGGSGIVPLMAMLRHRGAQRSILATRLLYSARTPEDIIYRDELDTLAARKDGLEVIFTFTRTPPAGWKGYSRRIDARMVGEVAKSLQLPRVFICGPTPLVETAATAVVQVGVPAHRVKTERFGPTGK